MTKLSDHFDTHEFACHCGCGYGTRPGDVSADLIDVLEDLRAHFGAPVRIFSGCRCEAHNKAVGGAPRSQHCHGVAADIQVRGHTPAQVADYLEQTYPKSCGIGRYRSWVHFDVRQNGPARWDYA